MTPKQDAFAQAYVETGNASKAYRLAGYSTRQSAEAIHQNASKLLTKVLPRVQELQQKHLERHDVTIDSLLDELEAARIEAMKNPRGISAAVSAIMGKAKLLGLVVDKAEHTGANGAPLVPVLNVSLSPQRLN
jgi:hypothetical protein